MNKKNETKQLKTNRVFIIAIVVLFLYSAFLTYGVMLDRAASESRDNSIVEMIFKQQVEDTKK